MRIYKDLSPCDKLTDQEATESNKYAAWVILALVLALIGQFFS
jgi:hypothetical protein